jgi:hypothetical protein
MVLTVGRGLMLFYFLRLSWKVPSSVERAPFFSLALGQITYMLLRNISQENAAVVDFIRPADALLAR